jgi:peptidoglycan hydrolase CwlO-like protein
MVFAFAHTAAGPASASGTQDELHRARARLADLRTEYRLAEARVQEVRAAIQSLTNQISQVTAHLAELGLAIDQADSGIRRSENHAHELQSSLDARARDVYIEGPAGVLELILEAHSLKDLTDRFSFLDAISRGDATVADGLEAQRQELADLRATLTDYQDQEQDLRASLVGKTQQLEARWESEEAARADLQDKVDQAQGIVKDLEEKLRQELIDQYGFVGGGAVGPAPGGGPFSWCPVDPPRSFSDDFGAPRYAGGYHPHAGNDILAPEGTPIRAPFDGVAVDSTNGLGGNAVSVTGAAGHVYNAHLSAFGTLGQVSAGTIVGYVGNSGDAQGGPTHDHFEWHPDVIPPDLHESPYGYTVIGDAIDPYPFLLAACG